MTGGLSWTHWVIIIAVFVLLFGAKKLPDAARSVGKSLRIFKSEIKEMQADSTSDTSAAENARPEAPSATPIASERVDPATPTANGSDVAAGTTPVTEEPSDKRRA